MAGNNNITLYSNTKDTFPASVTAVGTISAVNGLNKKIVGVGTSFTTAARIGDWIYVPSEDELRQIEAIVNDLELTVSEGFTNGFSGQAFAVTPKSTYRLISWAVLSATANPEIDGTAVPVGAGDTKDVTGAPAMSALPDPILIDSPSADVLVSFK
jgi:hypothetical protein